MKNVFYAIPFTESITKIIICPVQDKRNSTINVIYLIRDIKNDMNNVICLIPRIKSNTNNVIYTDCDTAKAMNNSFCHVQDLVNAPK